MSYSQYGEDDVILQHVGATPGRCLSVGEFDGKCFSNTLALIERGWGAVLVEPAPIPFSALANRHKDNPKVTAVNALVGVSPHWSLKKFWSSPDALSTTEQANYDKWKNYGQFNITYMPEMPLMVLLAVFPGPYEFISIDTEGTSVDLLKCFDLNVLKTKVVCVEHDNRLDEVMKHLNSFGFKNVLDNGCNLIGVRA